MGRLIDTSDLHNKVMLNKSAWGIFATQIDNLIEGVVMQVSTAEAISKADYENRLKADKVAMLEEISLKFDEQYYVNRHELHDDSLNVGLEQGQSIIQQKIDALKAESEG